MTCSQARIYYVQKPWLLTRAERGAAGVHAAFCPECEEFSITHGPKMNEEECENLKKICEDDLLDEEYRDLYYVEKMRHV